MIQVLRRNIEDYCRINKLSTDIKEVMIESFFGSRSLINLYDRIDDLDCAGDPESKVTNDSLPQHYSKYEWEPINFIVEFNLTFAEGNVIKYLSRFNDKSGKKDLEKVKFYSCVIRNGNFDFYSDYLN